MTKTGIIWRHEWRQLTGKRSYRTMTLLGPFLLAILLILPIYWASRPAPLRVITVLDESLLLRLDRGTAHLKFRYLPPKKFDRERAQQFFEQSDDYAFLYIPFSENGDPDFLARNVLLQRYGELHPEVIAYVKEKLEKYLQAEKLKAAGIDPAVVAGLKAPVKLRLRNLQNPGGASEAGPLKPALGGLGGLLVGLFLAAYASAVGRQIAREKGLRIMEILVALAPPRHFLVAKLGAHAAAALGQFVSLVGIGTLLVWLLSQGLLQEQWDALRQATDAAASADSFVFSFWRNWQRIDFWLLGAAWTFYLVLGYALYAALFALAGAYSRSEVAFQSWLLPLFSPLLLALPLLYLSLRYPEGTLAYWASLLPFTAPIVMPGRLPFGVPVEELALSAGLLIAFALLALLAAGRAFRISHLLYGQKGHS